MTPEEYEQFRNGTMKTPTISVAEVGEESRTVLVGYTVDRDEFTVEVVAGEFEVWVNADVIARGTELEAWQMNPGKRAYIEDTDLRFALAMHAHGEHVAYIPRYRKA